MFQANSQKDDSKKKSKKKERNESKRTVHKVFFLTPRYHTRDGHMKLANAPTYPFPAYRVSSAPCFTAKEVRETTKIAEGEKKGLEKKV